MKANPKAVALYLGEFFVELMKCGVRNIVVSPGSRSTPLAMAAFELSERFPDRLRVLVDVDERGAAFVALGMGKATGVPAAVVCTSGTAVGNWYPAVLEAESSRVPLLLLSGDRPPQLQGLGAPQTCDQLHAFGTHVRAFRQMMLPSDDAEALAFARQAALEAVFAAQGEAAAPKRIAGACNGGPVHLNFPFDEPLKPGFSAWDEGGLPLAGADPLGSLQALPPLAWSRPTLDASDSRSFARLLAESAKPLVLAGEGTCATDEEAAVVLNWAHRFSLPLLADPLSGLRRFGDLAVIDGYDSIVEAGGVVPEALMPDLVIRFGRYPVSKKASQLAQAAVSAGALSVVVDRSQSRDFNSGTGMLVACDPADFARALTDVAEGHVDLGGARPAPAPAPGETVKMEPLAASASDACDSQNAGLAAARDVLPGAPEATGSSPEAAREAFLLAWQQANHRAAAARAKVADATKNPVSEGFYVRTALELAPEGLLVFAANSMSIRALDTFYPKGRKLMVLCNRGLNGIDGTLSSAVGAALAAAEESLAPGARLSKTAVAAEPKAKHALGDADHALEPLRALFITGDLTLQHDLNALALQRELLRNVARPVSLTILLLNNNGGAIFDMLPQSSEDPYFERLFLTPQDVDFQAAAKAFAVPSWKVSEASEFEAACMQAACEPGLSLVEVTLPLRGVKERYQPYWNVAAS